PYHPVHCLGMAGLARAWPDAPAQPRAHHPRGPLGRADKDRGAGGHAVTCSPAPSVHGGNQGMWCAMNAVVEAPVAEKVAPAAQASPDGSADSPVTSVLGPIRWGPALRTRRC